MENKTVSFSITLLDYLSTVSKRDVRTVKIYGIPVEYATAGMLKFHTFRNLLLGSVRSSILPLHASEDMTIKNPSLGSTFCRWSTNNEMD
jgi:hypothetical protein